MSGAKEAEQSRIIADLLAQIHREVARTQDAEAETKRLREEIKKLRNEIADLTPLAEYPELYSELGRLKTLLNASPKRENQEAETETLKRELQRQQLLTEGYYEELEKLRSEATDYDGIEEWVELQGGDDWCWHNDEYGLFAWNVAAHAPAGTRINAASLPAASRKCREEVDKAKSDAETEPSKVCTCTIRETGFAYDPDCPTHRREDSSYILKARAAQNYNRDLEIAEAKRIKAVDEANAPKAESPPKGGPAVAGALDEYVRVLITSTYGNVPNHKTRAMTEVRDRLNKLEAKNGQC